MDSLSLIYILAFIATLTVLIIAGAAFVGFYRASQNADQAHDRYEEQRAKLPEATRWADLTNKVSSAEQRLTELSDQVADAQVTIEEKRAAEAWLEKHQNDLLTVEGKVEQIEKVKAELEAHRHELSQLDEQMTIKRREADKAESRRDRMQEERSSIENAINHEQERLDTVRQRVETMGNEESVKSAKLANLDQQISDDQERQQSLQQEISQHKGELEKANKELGEARAEHQRLESDCKRIEAEARSLENTIATLKAMHEKTLEELRRNGQDDNGESAAELWEPVIHPVKHPDCPAHINEQEAIESVERHLQDQGLHFSGRTLRSLHTSLKIADQSPLLILAGISGTGKSELPRRYAQAMGMNFLPIAVQPRWDSPQDMFGFFNYLENRYRPTELTRALIQMDRFGEEDGRGWQAGEAYEPLDNEMLLVLLDEMNLARVEYYFSELLSRLETRRGINRDDPLDRAKAEIALEVGRWGGGNQNRDGMNAMMRLFVDTNVLFVGTMNEDETTQSLSDKVMDRANMLQFGKPQQLKSQGIKTGGRPGSSVASLSHNAWQKWIRSDAEFSSNRQESDQVNQWIASLNNAMHGVGRPFAFRVNDSIRAYVANYPGQGPKALQDAMADQIELRILPKLRGLDVSEGPVSEAISSVQGLLANELKDEKLANAVSDAQRQAQESHDRLFVWRGLDRSDALEAAQTAGAA